MPRRKHYPAELRKLIKQVKALGWTVTSGKRNTHIRFIPPDATKRIIVASDSPSNRGRMIHHLIADLRREGAEI